MFVRLLRVSIFKRLKRFYLVFGVWCKGAQVANPMIVSAWCNLCLKCKAACENNGLIAQ